MPSDLDYRDGNDDNSSNTDWSSVEYWEGVAESVVRVTAAGFAGSLIGLAKERLYQTQQQSPINETPYSSTTVTSKVFVYEPPNTSAPAKTLTPNVSLSKRFPRRPPQLPIQATTSAATSAMTNLPIVWSISCMLFTIILESCRLSSPTNVVLQLLNTETAPTSSFSERDVPTRIEFQHQVQRTAITSFGDYALGGTIAGLAGAIGQRKHQHQKAIIPIANRIPTARFGLATGFGLGIIAGTFQAAIDVSNLYLKERERRDNEKRQEQNQDDQVVTEEVDEEQSK
jgi:single-stranded DNA-binding protein